MFPSMQSSTAPNNGRVDVLYGKSYDMHHLFEPSVDERSGKGQMDFSTEAIKGTHAPSRLSDVFFSATNINALQDALRYRVYRATCERHVIGRQSDADLKVIMRAVYFENARHDPNASQLEVLEEVRRINGLVLDKVTPQITQEIKMYARYRKDITSLPTPMDRGVAATIKGESPVVLRSL